MVLIFLDVVERGRLNGCLWSPAEASHCSRRNWLFPSQYLLLNMPSVILSMSLKSRATWDTPINIRRSGFPIKSHCLGVLYESPPCVSSGPSPGETIKFKDLLCLSFLSLVRPTWTWMMRSVTQMVTEGLESMQEEVINRLTSIYWRHYVEQTQHK